MQQSVATQRTLQPQVRRPTSRHTCDDKTVEHIQSHRQQNITSLQYIKFSSDGMLLRCHWHTWRRASPSSMTPRATLRCRMNRLHFCRSVCSKRVSATKRGSPHFQHGRTFGSTLHRFLAPPSKTTTDGRKRSLS